MTFLSNILKKRLGDKKGFTLVELIVVVAIMVVLISLMVPNIIGYIQSAQSTAAMADTRNIVNGVQSALTVEAAQKRLNVQKKMKLNGKTVTVGTISNTAIHSTLINNTNTPKEDRFVASEIIDKVSIIAWDEGAPASGDNKQKPMGQNCAEFLKNVGSDYGIILLFDAHGSIPFMQLYHNGVLVTYANGRYISNASNTAKFIDFGQSFTQPFLDAGYKESELPDEIKKSVFVTKTEWNNNVKST